MKVSILVPTYRRPAALRRCLEAICRQERHADQVLVVVRSDDAGTVAVADSFRDAMPLEILEVRRAGQVHALNQGLERSSGDVVAITDDDAVPRPDWLARIEQHFSSDPKIGGVGGRDWLYNDGIVEMGERKTVGKVLWFGRIVGDHHLGHGGARDVDILKGANCAFRVDAIRTIGFDPKLRGLGAQVHNDMKVSLEVKRAGWRLVYDPRVAVDHYLGKRHDRDQRGILDGKVTADRAFNLRLAISEIQPTRLRNAAIIWQFAVGTRDAPGVLWIVRLFLRNKQEILKIYRAVIIGWHEGTNLVKTQAPRSPP